MDKKKKVILISVAIIILAIVVGTVIFINSQKSNNQNTEELQNTKTSQLYNKILEAKEIIVTQALDDNNKTTIAIKDDNGYKEVVSDGSVEKYIVKNGDTYYIDESNKKYYRYQSNDMILTEIKEQFEDLYEKPVTKGKEKVNGKTYNYEEITGYQDFLINEELSVNNLEYAKTRLYYDSENLVYIKTIVGENEEIIKVNISYNVNDDYFNIPEDYIDGRND